MKLPKLPDADALYNHVISGQVVPRQKTAEQIAQEYQSRHEDPDRAADRLIAAQCRKVAASGLVGVLPMPMLTIPADIAISAYFHFRMVVALGVIYGFDQDDDYVRAVAMEAVVGSGATTSTGSAAAKVAKKKAEKLIEGISVETINRINKAVMPRFITKAGKTGVVNLSKAVPFAGGVVSSGINYAGTRIIGRRAKASFKEELGPRGAEAATS